MIAAARRRLGRMQFTALLAASMSMAALGIDLLLPAFGAIRSDLGLPADSTAVAGLITAYFLGLAIGQPLYGPASDRFGRKPVLYVGFAVYGIAALATAAAPTLPLLLVGRLLWGIGAAGPRVIVVAMIRDRFEGEEMSRAMSMVMSVFMVVPVFAPSLGAAAVALASWRWLFIGCAAAVGLLALLSARMQETLAPEHRRRLGAADLAEAAGIVVRNRQTVGYTLAMTALYAGFTSYLASSEIIFGEVFGEGDRFPLYFGGIAIVMGGAMVLNARIVQRFGSRRLSHSALVVYLATTVVLLASSAATGGHPPLVVFVGAMATIMACHAVIIPNFNALAMAPMASVAGMASSVTGAVQVAAGASMGAVIDRMFDGTVLPLSIALIAFGVLSAMLVMGADRRPLVLRAPRTPANAGPRPVATSSG